MTRSPLEQACCDGDLDAVRSIITGAEHAQLSELDLDVALCAAIDQGHRDIASLLLDHGAPMSNEPIRHICNREDVHMVATFLDHGWDPNTQFVDGEPPLRLILHDGESAKLMLQRGADPNLVGQHGATPLVSAVVSCNAPEVVELLISYGAVLNPEYIYEALQPRAKASETMTKYLLERGVDVNTPSERWSTPLHFAVYQRSPSKVKLLLDEGADPTAIANGRNYTGLTPAQLAKSKGAMDLYHLIEAACVRYSK